MRSQAVGYALAVIQAILYSTMGVIGKYLFGTGLEPPQVMVLRFSLTFLLLGAFLVVWRRQPLFSRQPLVYVQGVFFVGSALLYFMAVNEITAGLATVILYAYPAVVALMGTLVFRERLTKRIVAALVLAMAGVVLISGVLPGSDLQLSPLGVLYGVGACLTFAVYSVLEQKVVKKDGTFTITFSLTAVSLAVLAVSFPTTFPTMFELTPTQLGLGAAMALFNTVIPVALLLISIKIIGATKASLVGTSETPFSLLFAYLVLGETLTALQGIGCVLVVASIFVVTLPGRAERRERKNGQGHGEPAEAEGELS